MRATARRSARWLSIAVGGPGRRAGDTSMVRCANRRPRHALGAVRHFVM